MRLGVKSISCQLAGLFTSKVLGGFDPAVPLRETAEPDNDVRSVDLEHTAERVALMRSLQNQRAHLRFRIRIDNTITGSINGGGVDLTIRTLNGGVYIRKKK